jgi:hypothetical protein
MVIQADIKIIEPDNLSYKFKMMGGRKWTVASSDASLLGQFGQHQAQRPQLSCSSSATTSFLSFLLSRITCDLLDPYLYSLVVHCNDHNNDFTTYSRIIYSCCSICIVYFDFCSYDSCTCKNMSNSTCFSPKAPQEGPPLFQHGNIVFQGSCFR